VCLTCPAAGSSSPAGSTSSTACIEPNCKAGYTGPGFVHCTACVAGKYKDTTGNLSCTPCPANSNSPTASSAITACTCNAGFSGPDGGTCTTCAFAKYKPTLGSEPCSNCPVNSNTSSVTKTNVNDCLCLPGHTNTAPNNPSFVSSDGYNNPCDYYFGNTGTCTAGEACGSCRECWDQCVAEGKQNAAMVCSACTAGTYKSILSTAACIPCAGGTWSSTNAATTCTTVCPLNSIWTSSGVCSCNAGYTGLDNSPCEPCVRGTFKNSTGRDCMMCSRGKYSDTTASTVCKTCSNYMVSAVGSSAITQCVCTTGYTNFTTSS
jgi:hypothetical protein